jgi:hypothetical protein
MKYRVKVRVTDGYELVLPQVADACLDFVLAGKGEERHGRGRPLADQPWLTLEREFPGFTLAQACKKMMEAAHLPDKDRQIREVQGAVGYALLWLAKQEINS